AKIGGDTIMPRIARMIIDGEPSVYHVMSHTALDGFPFGDIEKDYFFKIVKGLSKIYFSEIIGICCMGNHFHLLVRMLPESDFSDIDIKQRFERLYGIDRFLANGQIPFFRAKWSSLSEFVKDVKLGFSRFYNKRHNRRGFLWGDRFKSVIVENGMTLINCLAYIDLNPVRAGIAEKPEDYRWNSIGYHIQTNNADNFLSLDFGLTEFGVIDATQRLKEYRRFLYESGAIRTEKGVQINQKILEKERDKDFELGKAHRLAYRSRYFSDSGIIGTKAFVSKNYQQFRHIFQSQNEKISKRISGLDGVYSLKRLSE
ncbi:transposase, partial [Thermodesulfobacteriota bacterium]